MKSLVLTGHERPLTFIQFNPDGDLFFTCGKDGFLNCWIYRQKKRLGRYNTGKAMVSNCDVTLDCVKLLATSADSKVFIFEVATGRELYSISENGPVRFAEWNRMPGHQDKFVVSQDGFGQKSKPALKIYHKKGDRYDQVVQIADYKSRCTRVKWGPYDETVISTHEDGKVLVWCAESGEKIHDIQAHTGSVTDVTFTEDRMLMLTCSADKTGKLWDTVKFNVVKTYNTDRPLNACSISPLWDDPNDPRPHIAFGGGQSASDVTTTAASEGKFQAVLYHMIYGHQLGALRGHYSPINAITFFPDGMGLATGAEEGNCRIVAFGDEYTKAIEA